MLTIADVTQFLDTLCPATLAETWDNTGLLLGDATAGVQSVMTCLTLSRRTCQEAIDRGADLVVAHHPVPFRPIRSITTTSYYGWILWRLASHRIAVYSPHTAFDSCPEGINAQLASMFELQDIRPLRPLPADELIGGGRVGSLPQTMTLLELAQRVKQKLGVKSLQMVGSPESLVMRVAVACGAAGEFLDDARRCGCEAIVLGEAKYHTLLEAEYWGIGMVLVGHYPSERHGVEKLAEILRKQFPQLEVWASQCERDPVRWV